MVDFDADETNVTKNANATAGWGKSTVVDMYASVLERYFPRACYDCSCELASYPRTCPYSYKSHPSAVSKDGVLTSKKDNRIHMRSMRSP